MIEVARAVAPPATTQVTIGVDANTKIRVNGRLATLADLRPNATFRAVFSGQPTDPIATLVANPAVSIEAKNPPRHRQLFAFVGTVTDVSSSAGTVTVNVSQSLPNSLVPSGSGPLAFAVDRRTLVLGGNAAGGLNGGSLSGVQVGDVVAGGTVGWSDMTLTEVQALPLRLLIDFPVASTTGGAGPNPSAQTKALRRALSLLGVKTAARTTRPRPRPRRRHGEATRRHTRASTVGTRNSSVRTRPSPSGSALGDEAASDDLTPGSPGVDVVVGDPVRAGWPRRRGRRRRPRSCGRTADVRRGPLLFGARCLRPRRTAPPTR